MSPGLVIMMDTRLGDRWGLGSRGAPGSRDRRPAQLPTGSQVVKMARVELTGH